MIHFLFFFVGSLWAVFDERITSFISLSEWEAPKQQQNPAENVRKEAYSVCNCLAVCNLLFPPDDSHLSTFIVLFFSLLRFHTALWTFAFVEKIHASVTSAPQHNSVIGHNFTFIFSYHTQQHSLQSAQNNVVAPISIETKFRCVYCCVYTIRMHRNSTLQRHNSVECFCFFFSRFFPPIATNEK